MVLFFLRIVLPIFQTEEEREWFASAFESRNDVNLTSERKTALANLMLKSQVFIYLMMILLEILQITGMYAVYANHICISV